MKYVIALIVALVLNAGANLMMKAGMVKVQEGGGLLSNGLFAGVLTILTSPILLAGLISFALNAACYMFALQSPTLKISVAYPAMVGGGYVIIATVAYFWLGERLTVGQWVGVALVLSGVMTIALRTPTAVGAS